MIANVKNVEIDAEVILFSDELERVLILSKGVVQKEYNGKRIIPIYSKGRLFNIYTDYNGEKYKSYVVGFNKSIKSEYHVIGDYTDEEIQNAITNNDIKLKYGNEESNIILLIFNDEFKAFN